MSDDGIYTFDQAEFTSQVQCPYRLLSNLNCIFNADHPGPHESTLTWRLWEHSPIVRDAECLRCHHPVDDPIHEGYKIRRVT